jgi:hypothetical protein
MIVDLDGGVTWSHIQVGQARAQDGDVATTRELGGRTRRDKGLCAGHKTVVRSLLEHHRMQERGREPLQLVRSTEHEKAGRKYRTFELGGKEHSVWSDQWQQAKFEGRLVWFHKDPYVVTEAT